LRLGLGGQLLDEQNDTERGQGCAGEAFGPFAKVLAEPRA
jgi:hypothetical protein